VVVLEHEDGRQQRAVDTVERDALQPGRHAGTCGRTLGEIERELAAVLRVQRQAGGQRCTRGGLAVQPAHLDQAVEQRVRVDQVLPQALHGSGVGGSARGGVGHGVN
jgi:hypothetical protein